MPTMEPGSMDELMMRQLYRSGAPLPPAAEAAPGGQARAAFQAGEVRRLLEEAPGFIAVARGPNFIFEMVNAAFVTLAGERDYIGRPVREALPELGRDSYERLAQVYRT